MPAPKIQVPKWVVHYRETSESPQWDKEFPTKPEADAFAYQIFLDGGISVTVEDFDEADDPLYDPATEPEED